MSSRKDKKLNFSGIILTFLTNCTIMIGEENYANDKRGETHL